MEYLLQVYLTAPGLMYITIVNLKQHNRHTAHYISRVWWEHWPLRIAGSSQMQRHMDYLFICPCDTFNLHFDTSFLLS